MYIYAYIFLNYEILLRRFTLISDFQHSDAHLHSSNQFILLVFFSILNP